jgi:hypothetical protein
MGILASAEGFAVKRIRDARLREPHHPVYVCQEEFDPRILIESLRHRRTSALLSSSETGAYRQLEERTTRPSLQKQLFEV